MENLKKIAIDAEKFALSEIEKYGLPSKIHLKISIDEGVKLAKKLNVDEDLVKIGVCLMDIKLGQAFKENKVKEHINMSALEAKKFLGNYEIENDVFEKIIEAVEGHHGKEKFNSLEAEIVANADCYRFVSAKGIFHFIVVLGKRFNDFIDVINGVEAKMNEKMNIVSLDVVKEELEPIYKNMKKYFADAKN